MNCKSLLKLVAFSAATLTLNLTFLPASNASEAESKLKVTQEQDAETKLWGEIQGDFDSCQTPRESATAISAQKVSSENRDRAVATNELNNISVPTQVSNSSLPICE